MIERLVLFGPNGEHDLQYCVDAYQPDWRCGLDLEAGRAWKGNAISRDLIQALVMVQVDALAFRSDLAFERREPAGRPSGASSRSGRRHSSANDSEQW